MATNTTTASFFTTAFWTHAASLATILFITSAVFNAEAQPKVLSTQILEEPVVINEKVTLKVKVKGEGDRPVVDLVDTDFKILVDGKEVKFNPRNWESAKDNNPPAYIIVLLDMSGSMKNNDAKGQRKLKGAVQAVQAILKSLTERTKLSPNIQVAIVPFGNSGSECTNGFPVNNETLNKFFVAGDIKLTTYLESEIGSIDPCASTNLYKALGQAVKFLGNSSDARFYPPVSPEETIENKKPQPKLAVILLSDGFDSEFFDKDKEEVEKQEFDKLQKLLKRNDQVVVHTLGYGLTPSQVGSKYNLGSPATRKNIWSCYLFDLRKPPCKDDTPPTGKVPAEEFVDEQRLKEVAGVSGGLSAFGADAQEIADKLQIFLDAILGEYKISYDHPNPRRGKKHSVVVTAANIPSDSKPYRISVFGRTLPQKDRLNLLGLVVLGCGGVGSGLFLLWRKSLTEEID